MFSALFHAGLPGLLNSACHPQSPFIYFFFSRLIIYCSCHSKTLCAGTSIIPLHNFAHGEYHSHKTLLAFLFLCCCCGGGGGVFLLLWAGRWSGRVGVGAWGVCVIALTLATVSLKITIKTSSYVSSLNIWLRSRLCFWRQRCTLTKIKTAI